MRREFNVEATVGKPQVAYRETIRKVCNEVEGKFVKQSGGRGQYGHVVLKVEPLAPGGGYEFVDAIKGGVVPREYIPAVDKGIQETLPSGVLAGYPIDHSATPACANMARSRTLHPASRWSGRASSIDRSNYCYRVKFK